ncbi:hypothetical protein [Agreia sp. VKM Ac-1783]|jgi:hypothetical protein|uniref:hypothetical protein n=1 Tax=Agreia sp. VKM Ac-1783 TaxID=1938889 RepID=UPI000A2AD26A|nr:hypothetical protein [Agreia sp. VKM Ac-1783]SMQ71811.1 hypothetical protein SAMN06295943_2699 [Agreia sp. VKM Ac-1783]
MSLVIDSMPSPSTAPDSITTEGAATQLHWHLVFDGVWLARREGRFAGMVQGMPGHPAKLTDACGNLCGLYKSVDDAKGALLVLSR